MVCVFLCKMSAAGNMPAQLTEEATKTVLELCEHADLMDVRIQGDGNMSSKLCYISDPESRASRKRIRHVLAR